MVKRVTSAPVSKLKSEKTVPMIKGGGRSDLSGPTGGNMQHPKGGAVSLKADFLPNKGKRSKTGWLTRGV